MTTFYCLRFETLQPGGPGLRIYMPQEQGGPVSGGILASIVLLINPLHGQSRRHRFQQYLHCCMRMLLRALHATIHIFEEF
jgi:hypothetical protein